MTLRNAAAAKVRLVIWCKVARTQPRISQEADRFYFRGSARSRPLVRVVLTYGQGWINWNSRLTEAKRGCLAEAETGSAAPTASKTQMRRAVLIARRPSHRGRQPGVIVPVSAVVREVSCSLAARLHQ
jgi:hypothetical protein